MSSLSPVSKRVLVVEDQPNQRNQLCMFLQRAGYDAVGAGTPQEALAIVEDLAKEFDVFVLDMRLVEPENVDVKFGNVSGADVGARYLHVRKERKSFWRPEFLVTSAFGSPEYYEAAGKIGVAAYLEKQRIPTAQTVYHVQALTLMRAMSLRRPGMKLYLEDHASDYSNAVDSVGAFCTTFLLKEFRDCFGTAFVITLAAEDKFRAFWSHEPVRAENAKNPENFEGAIFRSLKLIHQLAQGSNDQTNSYEYNYQSMKEKMAQIVDLKDKYLDTFLETLTSSRFLAIRLDDDVSLTIGVLADPSKLAPDGTPFLPAYIDEVLRRYLAPAIFRLLAQLMTELRKGLKEREAILSATSQLAFFVGCEMNEILAATKGESETTSLKSDQRFRTLRNHLFEAAEILQDAFARVGQPVGDVESFAEIGNAILEKMSSLGREELKASVRIEGDCAVNGPPDAVALLVSKVLDLFYSRRWSTLKDRQNITITCREEDDQSVVEFKDSSQVIPEALRSHLTGGLSPSPIASVAGEAPPELKGALLPLFLAQLVAERRCRGVFKDTTQGGESEYGNSFEFRFPHVQAFSRAKS